MPKRGRSKPKPKWKFHVPSKRAPKKPKRRLTPATLGKAEERHVRIALTGRWTFNDPATVARVKNDPYPDRPDIRHEIPLGEPWDCKYGCTPFVWTHGQLHGHACPYWANEGGNRTPF